MEQIKLTAKNQAQALAQAVTVLRAGGLVVFPTETLYGAAVDATNPRAVDKLLVFKKRPAGKAISVLVADVAAALTLVDADTVTQQNLARLLPGPVTVVCHYKQGVDPRLCSEHATLGIRISSHPFAAALAAAYGKPLTATSANPAGGARPYTVDRLTDRQKNQVDLIIDAGQLPPNEPSTVVDFTGGEQTILRAGGKLEELVRPLPTASEEETQAIAREITRSLFHALREKPVILALSGDMGMGKTQFAKGVAEALQVQETVTSPSYTLMKEYHGMADGNHVTLVHLDCWRAENLHLSDLQLQDYFEPGTLLVIEWPQPLLPELAPLVPGVIVHHYFFRSTPTGREIVLTSL